MHSDLTHFLLSSSAKIGSRALPRTIKWYSAPANSRRSGRGIRKRYAAGCVKTSPNPLSSLGYYFQCRVCQSNTSVRFTCQPGHKPRLRKSGDEFFRDCPECGDSRLFFANA
jgi:hypothetical protein